MTIDHEEGIAVIALNRRDVLNALSQDLVRALDGILDGVIADETIRVVVVTGAGKAFSPGGDVIEFATQMNASPARLIEALSFNQRVFEKLEALPIPVIAAVNGWSSQAASRSFFAALSFLRRRGQDWATGTQNTPSSQLAVLP